MNLESKQYHLMRWILFWIFVALFLLIVVCTVLVVFFGIGSPNEEERSLLFKWFLGEIGAAVIALFYAIFGIRQAQFKQAVTLDESEEFSTAVPDAAQELREIDHTAVDVQVREAGVTRFVQSRDHYARVRESATIDGYVDTAQKEIVMVSINLMTGVPFDGLCEVLSRRLNSESNPVMVTISLLNPWKEFLMASIAPSIGTARLSESIQDTLRSLWDMREGLSRRGKDQLVLRLHNAVPFASAIMLDPDEANGRIQIETKPYKTPLMKSFAIEFKDVGEGCLYQTIRASYRRLISEADGLDPKLLGLVP